MRYYHSALYHHLTREYDRFDWNRLENFSFLVPYDLILNGKFKPVAKKEAELIESVHKLRRTVPGLVAMLDCGAFSAYRQGFEIDVHDFIDFIKRHPGVFDTVVALDKINNPQGTWENYQIMRDAGIDIAMPVFHVSEPDEYLQKYVAVAPYVGFSPPFGAIGDTCVEVYQAQLYNKDGSIRFPNTKFHGFGVGTPVFFQVYPWTSCDSSNSAIYGRYGSVLMPKLDKRVLKFQRLFVSAEQQKQEQHYIHLPPQAKQAADEEFARFGFTFSHFNEEMMNPELPERERRRCAHINRVMYNILSANYIVDSIEKNGSFICPPERLL